MTVDRYIGDGMLIFFGDAEPEPADPSERESQVDKYAAAAVTAGIEMQLKMQELNR